MKACASQLVRQDATLACLQTTTTTHFSASSHVKPNFSRMAPLIGTADPVEARSSACTTAEESTDGKSRAREIWVQQATQGAIGQAVGPYESVEQTQAGNAGLAASKKVQETQWEGTRE